jgi:hypothetical protein
MIDYTKIETDFRHYMDFGWHYIAEAGEILFFMKDGKAQEAFIFG